MSRRVRNIVSAALSFLVIAGVIAVAVQAEGREATRATSNDGGAWLADRGAGGVAHIEYTSRQPTMETQIADPRAEISVRQAPGVVAVHDRSTGVVKLVDPANAIELSSTAVPLGSMVRARPDGVAVFDPTRSTLWSADRGPFSGIGDIATTTPIVAAEAPGRALVDPAGALAVVTDTEILWPDPGSGRDDQGQAGPPAEPRSVPLPDGFEVVSATMVDGRVILAGAGGWLWAESDELNRFDPPQDLPLGLLQQEGLTWPIVGLTTADARGFVVDVRHGDLIELAPGVAQASNGPPIFHDRCLHSLGGTDRDMRFVAACLDGEVRFQDGLDIGVGSELRLVNGRVWIDALDGSGFAVSPDLELLEIADFSEIFDNSDGEESADGENIEERLDQNAEDAGLTEADQLDDDPENQPPVANDDEAATRDGRPVVVDVLANDSDPDGDVILVEEAEILSGADLIRLELPTARNSLQVTPTGGVGQATIRYEISDGSPTGTDTAVVTVDITAPAAEQNRAPVAVLDRVVGAAGSIVAVNVLDNDDDPDGDAIILESLGETGGVQVLSQHPGGDLLLALPSSVVDAEIEITYVVADEWQASSEGVLQVTVRLDEANTPPDARNDAGTTQVGRRITLDLLANDIDGDNDPLTVAKPPTLVDGDGSTGGGSGGGDPGLVTTTDDGEFVFQPNRAGTFVFQYEVSDGAGSDPALIRIEVTEPQANRAPIAVRDDVTLAWGETRLVRVLDNDGDPDGDLFGVLDYSASPNLDLVVDQGVGFRITMKPGAAPVETFQYRISDGELTSELATVVVNRSEAAFRNAPPVVTDDVAMVRAGRTSRLLVLRNDYDPEGGPLTVTEASATDGVEAGVASNGQWVEVSVEAGARLPFSVQYTAADDHGSVGAGSVRVGIVAPDQPNSPPIARPDVAYTIEGEPVAIPVLANDTDPESDALTLVSAPEAPAGGALTPSEDGTGFVYTPVPGFRGTDAFTYLVQDTEGDQSTGSVTVAVLAKPDQNRPPVAAPDLDWTFVAGGGRVTLNVLGNDSDPDGDDLTVISATGDAVVSASGRSILFDLPDRASEEIVVGFSYQVADGRGGTDEADVQFVVAPNVEPLPPQANPDTAGPARAGEQVTVDALGNDTDPDGDDATLTITSVGPGATIVDGGRALTITVPDASAEVAYTITDEQGLTASSFVSVTVEENLPPVVDDPIFLGEFFTDEPIPTVNLADHVTDPDGDELIFAGVSGQTGGTTQLDVNQRDQRIVSFLPEATFAGTAGFAFTVDDGNGHLVSGRVTLTLKGQSNQPPVGTDTTVTLEAGVDQPVALDALFTDPDPGDTLTFEVTQPGSPVTMTVAGTTATLSTPFSAGEGTTSFTVRATDQEGEQAEATVTISVTPSTVDPPTTNPDQGETDQEVAVTVDVAANDRSNLPDDPTLTVVNAFVVGGAGSATHTASDITFTPGVGFFGQAQIRYTIEDARGSDGGQSEGVLTVNVIGRPDPVVITNAAAVGPRDVTLTWLTPADNGGPIEGYRIRVNGSEIRDVPGTNPQYVFTDRVPGTSYDFEVLAYNRAGDGPYGASVGPIVPDEAPGAPSTPVATFVPGQSDAIDLTWIEGPNEGSAILEYEVEISQCRSLTVTLGNVTSYRWTGLTPGVPCRFRARARNQADWSLWSPLSDAGVCPVGPPEAPARPTAVRGDKEATVDWAAPVNPDCQDPIRYELVRYRGGAVDGTTSVPFGTNTWNSAPLNNGDTYTFAVRAENRAGFGPLSPQSAPIIPCGVPLAPSAPTGAPGDRQVTVSHANDAGANGCAVTQYMVRVNPGGDQTLAGTGLVTGLVNGTSYTFSVAGVNEIGVGEFGPPSAAVIPFGLPGLPTITSTTSGGFYRWNIGGADPNGRPIQAYTVAGNVTSTANLPGGGGQVTCRNSLGNNCQPAGGAHLTPPTACRQRAGTMSVTSAAVNEAGTGPSANSSITLQGCPATPTLSVSAGNAQFTASWSRPSGTDAIYIQVDGNYGSPRSGSSHTFSATNDRTYTVRAWACNEFGCSPSTSRDVTPRDPRRVTAEWGALLYNPGGSCPINTCYEIWFNWSGFPANRDVTVECRNSKGTWLTFQRSTGGGSGRLEAPCFSDDDLNPPVHIRFDGVRSNDLPNND